VRFQTYVEALTWLESHIDFERLAPNHQLVPSLQPIVDTLALLADPHLDYPTVHITGTNGKGTTTTLTSALLSATGLRVGTFTSPDLHAINERIAVNAEPIDDESLVGLLSRLADVESVSGVALTRFELLTVAALLHFSDEGVDVAVIEVGMGGTWDSTNVINSKVAVLTNVDLDHTAVLGPTVSAIANDKVGIFRPETVAIVATTNAVVVEIARRKANELVTELWLLDDSFVLERNELALGGRAISVQTPFEHYEDVLVSLHGIHQGVNAATAIVAAEAFLGRALGTDVVQSTLRVARMPGRMELISRKPMIVVDGAHMVAPLVELGFTEFHCCAPQSPRAVPAGEVADAVRRHGGVAFEHPSGTAALAHARERSTDEDLIVVAGSLYLVAEVRGEILRVTSRHLS